MDATLREFELEMEQKTKSIVDSLKSKVTEVEKREAECKHREEDVTKREQALERDMEKHKEKKKALKITETSLESEMRKLLVDKQSVLNLEAELQKITAGNEIMLLQIRKAREDHRVTQTERYEHLCLQKELEDQRENCRYQQELLLKEGADLKALRDSFEKNWELLDHKKAEIMKKEQNRTDHQKKLERSSHLEEPTLKNENLKRYAKLGMLVVSLES